MRGFLKRVIHSNDSFSSSLRARASVTHTRTICRKYSRARAAEPLIDGARLFAFFIVTRSPWQISADLLQREM